MLTKQRIQLFDTSFRTAAHSSHILQTYIFALKNNFWHQSVVSLKPMLKITNLPELSNTNAESTFGLDVRHNYYFQFFSWPFHVVFAPKDLSVKNIKFFHQPIRSWHTDAGRMGLWRQLRHLEQQVKVWTNPNHKF